MKATLKMAIIEVLKTSNEGLSPKQIYGKICDQNLFVFKSKTPVSVINNEIRKSCEGVEIRKSKTRKEFTQTTKGKYTTNPLV